MLILFLRCFQGFLVCLFFSPRVFLRFSEVLAGDCLKIFGYFEPLIGGGR